MTGAGSGLGRATASLFAREGATVVAVDITGEQERTAAVAENGSVLPLHCDVSRPDDVRAAVDETMSRFGRLDALCSVAGVVRSNGVLLEDVDPDDWDQVQDVNFRGVFLCMKFALPAIVATGGGTVVNWASTGGLVVSGRAPAYSSAKAGVIHLTRNAAVQYGPHGVRVNCICPGFIRTEIFEQGPLAATAEVRESSLQALRAKSVLGREGRAEEVAEAALFLSTDMSSFVTGVALPVDGGWAVRSA